MVKEIGNFEINDEDHSIKIKNSEIYLVSKEKYGSHAAKVSSLFLRAYEYGRTSKSDEVKKVLGIR